MPLYGYMSPAVELVNATVTLLASGGHPTGAADVAAVTTVGGGGGDVTPVPLPPPLPPPPPPPRRFGPPPTELTVGSGVVAVHLRILATEERRVGHADLVARTVAAVERAAVHRYPRDRSRPGVDPDAGLYGSWPGGVDGVRGGALLAAARSVYVAYSPSSPASAGVATALRTKYGGKVFWFSREGALGGAAAAAAVPLVSDEAADGGGGRAAAAAAAHPVDWIYGPSIVDLWACVLADHFIGRDSSSFSGNIEQWRRGDLRSELPGGGGRVRVWAKEIRESLVYNVPGL